MKNLNLVKVSRIDENTVRVTYSLNNEEFTVEWNNIHPSTGDIGEFDLQATCDADNQDLEDRVYNAILEGEDDDNEDLELYLAIRDTFDRHDCEGILDISLVEIHTNEDDCEGFAHSTVELDIMYNNNIYNCYVQLLYGESTCDCQNNGFDEIEDEDAQSGILETAIKKAEEFYQEGIRAKFEELTLEEVKEILIKEGEDITEDSDAIDVEKCFSDNDELYSDDYTVKYYKTSLSLYLMVENSQFYNNDMTPYEEEYLAIKTYY